MNILVIGCNGYIGQNIIKTLILDENIVSITGIDVNCFGNFKSEKYQYFQCNLFDFKKMLKITRKREIDFIIDASNDFYKDDYLNNPINFYEKNIGKLLILYKICRYSHIKNFLYISNYNSNKKSLINNKCQYYNKAKIELENFIKNISDVYNMRYGILNVSNVIGKPSKKCYSKHNLIDHLFYAIRKNHNSLDLNDLFFYDDLEKLNYLSLNSFSNEIKEVVKDVFTKNKSVQKDVLNELSFSLSELILLVGKATNIDFTFSIKDNVINFDYTTKSDIEKFIKLDNKTVDILNMFAEEYNVKRFNDWSLLERIKIRK